MSLNRSGNEFNLILAALELPGEGKNAAKSVPGGGQEKHRFSRALFVTILPDLGWPWGSKSLLYLAPFAALFQSSDYFF